MIREEFRLHRDAGGKRRRSQEVVRSGEVTTVRVHPQVWETAMRLSESDASRIQIIGPQEVLITNGRTK